MKRTILYTLILGVVLFVASMLLNRTSSAQTRSSLSLDSDLKSPIMVTKGGSLEHARIMWNFFFNKPATTRPSGQLPVQALTKAPLLSAPNNTVYRLGHSTVLMKLNGAFWLTDPMFSDRASPLQFAGPKRFHAPPIGIDELPPIKGVIISHDHYDHLDYDSIMKLAGKTEYFLTPLGVGDILVDWGVPPVKVRQLDWWQETAIDAVRFVATPAQHFSGRGLFDKNQTQWASWVILAPNQRLFFSGDSGYFDGFKRIGEKYGPFDLTLLETGAYNANWPNVHMHPEESLQAHLDLKGKRLLPIHNGTFDLSMHPWREPFDRKAALGKERGIPIIAPMMGEAVSMHETMGVRRWWEGMDRIEGTERVQVKGYPEAEQL
jgi:L-ascorbate metabolism protein UlaG (beta-lactamase superfamily)